MLELELPVNEKQRIEALKRYHILDTPPDGAFDDITSLASSIFNVPIAIISLVDSERIWFKSHYGLSVNQIDRQPGLCASAILADDIYAVEDARKDPRTLANPLVAGEFGLQFYAATPLRTSDYYNLGTLCVIDKNPRQFTGEEKILLGKLGKIVMNEMELRLQLRSTVENIDNISSDLCKNLTKTVSNIEKSSDSAARQEILSYLESTMMYVQNLQNKIKEL
jgi:GAF domain-containing protein